MGFKCNLVELTLDSWRKDGWQRFRCNEWIDMLNAELSPQRYWLDTVEVLVGIMLPRSLGRGSPLQCHHRNIMSSGVSCFAVSVIVEGTDTETDKLSRNQNF